MRFWMRGFWGLLVIAAVAQPSAASEEKPDTDGVWRLVYFERDGKGTRFSDSETRAVFTGDKFVVKRGDEVIAAGTSKLDYSKTPHTSETTYTEGPDKGKTFKGIFEVKGDRIRFCRAGSPSDDTPKDFTTTDGSGRFVSTYERVKTE